MLSNGHPISTAKYFSSDKVADYVATMKSGLCVSIDKVLLLFVVVEILLLFSDSHPCIIDLNSNTVLLHHKRTYCRCVDVICCGKRDTIATCIA